MGRQVGYAGGQAIGGEVSPQPTITALKNGFFSHKQGCFFVVGGRSETS